MSNFRLQKTIANISLNFSSAGFRNKKTFVKKRCRAYFFIFPHFHDNLIFCTLNLSFDPKQ